MEDEVTSTSDQIILSMSEILGGTVVSAIKSFNTGSMKIEYIGPVGTQACDQNR